MNLLETNIYDAKGKVLICGTYLPGMQEKGFKKLEKEFDTIDKTIKLSKNLIELENK